MVTCVCACGDVCDVCACGDMCVHAVMCVCVWWHVWRCNVCTQVEWLSCIADCHFQNVLYRGKDIEEWMSNCMYRYQNKNNIHF